MRYHHVWRLVAGTIVALACASSLFAEPDSKRLARAKDLIADEQWSLAVDVLAEAARDPKEPNKDEVLFWLAHSENQVRDTAAALETIGRLEREFHASRWVKPAQSLRIEIAQRLRRSDVLWYTATLPPPAPAPPAPPAARGGWHLAAPRSLRHLPRRRRLSPRLRRPRPPCRRARAAGCPTTTCPIPTCGSRRSAA